MPIGPGKYDDLCSLLRVQTDAEACVVIVLGGNKGSGFSVQSRGRPLLVLPELLESLAKQIREDIDG